MSDRVQVCKRIRNILYLRGLSYAERRIAMIVMTVSDIVFAIVIGSLVLLRCILPEKDKDKDKDGDNDGKD